MALEAIQFGNRECGNFPFKRRKLQQPSLKETKQEEKILNGPVAMYRFNDVVVVILSGLIGGL